MDDGRVFVAVLGLERFLNAFLHALHADNRDERHHLFLVHEGMLRIRFREQQLGAGRQVDARSLRQYRAILADEITVHTGMGAAAALPFLEGKRRLGEPFELRFVQLHGAVLGQLLHQFVGGVLQDKHFLFTNAQQIVIKSAAGNDGLRRAGGTAGVIDKHRRIAGAGADGTLARLHGGFHHHRSAGDEQQAGKFVFAEGVEGIQRGFLDDARDVLNARFAVDGLVVGPHGGGGALGRARMRVEHHRIAGGGNVDNVAAQGGNGMRAGGDAPHHAKRRVFFQGDAVVAAAGVGAQPVHAGHQLDQAQLGDLVIQPADLRFVIFQFAPRLGVLFRQRLDDLLDLAPGGDALLAQLQKGFLRRGTGFVRILKHAEFAAQRDVGAVHFAGGAAAV